MENMQIMIEKLAKNEKFVKELGTAHTPEEVKTVFGAYGVEMTLEEATIIVETAKTIPDGELSAESLDNVSGGILMSTLGSCLVLGACVYAAATIGKMLLNRR